MYFVLNTENDQTLFIVMGGGCGGLIITIIVVLILIKRVVLCHFKHLYFPKYIVCLISTISIQMVLLDFIVKKELEDTKVVIIIRISKKNRQHNGQAKKYKKTNNDLQNMHIKLKID